MGPLGVEWGDGQFRVSYVTRSFLVRSRYPLRYWSVPRSAAGCWRFDFSAAAGCHVVDAQSCGSIELSIVLLKMKN